MIWCDKCGIFLAPLGKKPKTGERASAVLTDEVMVCVKCGDRHGITAETAQALQPETPAAPVAPAHEPTPAAELPAPAPAPVDPAQQALDTLPAWIKEDGARHGHNRLKAATAEAERLSGTATARTRVPVTPVTRDTKEAPKLARPVRRPSRPRREASPTALAAVAPASDTGDMAALDRMHHTQAGAPAPRPWAKEMPGPITPARPATARQRVPLTAITVEEAARRRRELALAYAERHGTDMAPPTRRPIVTAEEIRSGMRSVPPAEDGAPARFHPDVVLNRWEAAKYVGHTIRTFDRYAREGRIPSVENAKGGRGYRVAELDDYRAGRQTRPQPAPKPKADRVPKSSHPGPTASARRTAAQLKRDQAIARIDVFAGLLQEGVAREAAASKAGYANVIAARQACRRMNREDVLRLMPDLRRRTEERAA
ncbi:hypothetical protein [Kocuria oceani]|uniref:Helix-turn-helix domain-containing protein n=1 Tax=Kocuria oceani TaxID=988827 RepID=A0ABV9TIH4_9MICC|nr:hypothetical protein [Kocuria oceani]